MQGHAEVQTSMPDALSTPEVADEVGMRLARALEPEGGVEARLVDRRQFRWSEHLLYEIRGIRRGGDRVLVKRVKARDRRGRTQCPVIDPRARSLAEHDALHTLHRIFARSGVDGLTAVRPCGCFPELDALAMDYRPGQHLLSLIARATRPYGGSRANARAADAARRAGQWLAVVHRSLAAGDGAEEMPGGVFARRFLAELEPLSTALPDAAAPWLGMARRLARDGAAAAPQVRVLPLHGDFYPENIVVASGGLYAVDTTLTVRGPAEDDLARFLVGVDTLKLRVLAGGTLVRTEPLDGIRRAFLDGYRSLAPLAPERLVPAVVRACLVRWSELRSVAALDVPGPVVSVLRRRIDRFMTARLTHFLDDVVPAGSLA